jgi:hypothetical protein
VSQSLAGRAAFSAAGVELGCAMGSSSLVILEGAAAGAEAKLPVEWSALMAGAMAPETDEGVYNSQSIE